MKFCNTTITVTEPFKKKGASPCELRNIRPCKVSSSSQLSQERWHPMTTVTVNQK
jgi:hypothetical protein